jgi:hypothetical protein
MEFDRGRVFYCESLIGYPLHLAEDEIVYLCRKEYELKRFQIF